MLRIGKLTDYAIVVLAHMARHAHRCVHPATDLAEATSIPLPTVQKLLKTLQREGFVQSMRGARGGYALVDDPAQTSLLRLLESLEGPIAMTDCAAGAPSGCSCAPDCTVSGHWSIIGDAIATALGQVTLLDLARSRPRTGGVSPAPHPGDRP